MIFRKKTAALAFLFSMLMVAAPAAFAQVDEAAGDTTIAPGDTTIAPVDMVERPEAGTAIDQLNFSNALDAMNNYDTEMEAFGMNQGLTLDRIHIISVSTLMNEADEEPYNLAYEANAANLDSLHAFIDDNDLLEQAIDAKNIDHEDVFAIDVLEDGNVVLFYRDIEAEGATPTGQTGQDTTPTEQPEEDTTPTEETEEDTTPDDQ